MVSSWKEWGLVALALAHHLVALALLTPSFPDWVSWLWLKLLCLNANRRIWFEFIEADNCNFLCLRWACEWAGLCNRETTGTLSLHVLTVILHALTVIATVLILHETLLGYRLADRKKITRKNCANLVGIELRLAAFEWACLNTANSQFDLRVLYKF